MNDTPVDVAAKPPLPNPEHLGDGVYVAFDGFHMTISVNDHRAYPVVFMEQHVYNNLRAYAQALGWEK